MSANRSKSKVLYRDKCWWNAYRHFPIVHAFANRCNKNMKGVRCYVRTELSDLLGVLAEGGRSFVVSLYVPRNGELVLSGDVNHPYSERGPIGLLENHLVARATREWKTLVERFDRKAKSYAVSPACVYMLAHPLIANDRLHGVVALQSTSSFHLDEVISEIATLQKSASPLLALLQSSFDPVNFCPWNAFTQGWHINLVLRQFAWDAAWSVRASGASFTFWNADNVDQELHAVATSGYDGSLMNQALPLNDYQIGKLLNKGKTVQLSLENFRESKKAKELSIDPKCAWLCGFGNREKLHYGAVTAYCRWPHYEDDGIVENDRMAVKESLPVVAEFTEQFIEKYRSQRFELGRSYVRAVVSRIVNSALATRCDLWAKAIAELFDADAYSLFNFDAERNSLRCISSSGFYDDVWLRRSMDLSSHSYNLDGDVSSHTVSAFLNCKTIRSNNLAHDSHRVLRANAEFIAGEPLESPEHSQRKVLLSPVFQGEECMGVLRLVRGMNGRPFTKCDEEFAEMLCTDCAPDILGTSMDDLAIERAATI